MTAETDNQTEAEVVRPSFELEGKQYELPELRDLDIDEWMVVYKYSRVVLRDLMEIPDDPEAEAARVEKLEQPGVMKALFHIGYKRAHPRKTYSAVEDLVGQIKYLPALEAMNPDVEVPEDEVDPPTGELPSSESETSPSSESRTDSENENGSSDSGTASETLVGLPAITGTSG